MVDEKHARYRVLFRMLAIALILLVPAKAMIAEDADMQDEIEDGQLITWDADPAAMRYEITVRDLQDLDVLKETTTDSTLRVRLAPGSYRYNIVTWNLLEQPESETGWQPLTIIKAERPVVENTSPAFIFMDSLDGRITLKGEKLYPDFHVYLRDGAGTKTEGSVVSRTGNTEVVLIFPDRVYQPDTFDLIVVNPGGLKSVTKNALRIMFQRPIDILVSAGYSPVIFMQDDWFKSVWSDPVYWLGADAGLTVFFVKKGWGFIGIEAAASGFRTTAEAKQTKLTSLYGLAGANVVYKYRLTRMIHGIVRAGGGLAHSIHDFTYAGIAGPKTTTTDPYLAAGIALQYYFPNKMFLELGADWNEILADGHNYGGIRPALKVGYQLF